MTNRRFLIAAGLLAVAGLGAAVLSVVVLTRGAPIRPEVAIAITPNQQQPGPSLIQIARADGGGKRQLPVGDRHTIALSPLWSPDGKRLAFLLVDGEDAQVFVIDADGENLRRLTRLEALNIVPVSWSPDGRELLVRRAIEVDKSTMLRVDVETGHTDKIVPGKSDVLSAAWVGSTGDILVARREGDGQGRAGIVSRDGSERPLAAEHLDVQSATISPDGRTVALSAFNDAGGSIWLVGTDGNGLHRVSDGYAPVWAPDSGHLAFDCGMVVCVTDAKGGDLRRIEFAPGIPGPAHEVVWSPNGRELAFAVSLDQVNERIFIVRADGTGLRGLPVEAGVAQQDSPAWSPDGRTIAFMEAPGYVAAASPADGEGATVKLSPTDRTASRPAWRPAAT